MTDLLSSSTFWMTLSIGCYALGAVEVTVSREELDER